MSVPTMRELRLRWALYGPLPRCTADRTDPDYGSHCWGLVWPWQRQEGPMHARCRSSVASPEPSE
jgi:hypothetical protein